MEGLLFWIGIAMAGLLGLAIIVALWEHFRDSRSELPDEIAHTPAPVPTPTPTPMPQPVEAGSSASGRVAKRREAAPPQEA